MPPSTSSSPQPRPILLISASKVIRDHTAPALERYGFSVRWVDCLPEAVATLELAARTEADGSPSWQPELIITDSFSAEDTATQALQLLEWMEAQPRHRSLPVISIVGGHGKEALFEWYRNRDGHPRSNDRYLTAPFNVQEVVAIARLALNLPSGRRR